MNKTEIKIGESHYKYCIYTLYKAPTITRLQVRTFIFSIQKKSHPFHREQMAFWSDCLQMKLVSEFGIERHLLQRRCIDNWIVFQTKRF